MMDVNAAFARAEGAFAQGAYAAARAEAVTIVAAIGDHPAVLHLLALTEKRLGHGDAAVKAFQRALRGAPNDAQIHGNLANLFCDLGRDHEALPHYDRAIALAAHAAEPLVNRALLLERAGRRDAALADLERAVALAPRDARAWTAMGAILRDLERLDEAAIAFDTALSIAPERSTALSGRARVALERGEEDAVARYDAALALQPDVLELQLGRALATEADGLTGAAALLEQALDREPEWVEGHEQLARIRYEAADAGDPARSFPEALQRSPMNRQLHVAYWQTLIRAGRFAEALAAIDAARASLGEDRTMLLSEAVAADEAGDAGRAAMVMERLGTGADIDVPRARHYLRAGQPDRAARVLESVVAQNPDEIGAWAYLSLAWRVLEDDRYHWLAGQPGLHRVVDLDLQGQELDQLAELLRSLHRTRAHPIGQSLRGGSQTRGRLFARTEAPIRDLKRRVEAAVADHVAGLPPADPRHPLLKHRDGAFALAGSWSVRLRESGFHINHIHPQGVLSSALYVAVPPVAAAAGSQEGWLDLGAPPTELGLELAAATSVMPQPGRLALFPSYLFHGTRPFTAGERLTVAFDIRAG